MTLDTQADLITQDEAARLLTVHNKAIEALGSVAEVLAYADRLKASGFPDFMMDELLHHLERRRVELLRKQGAFVP